MNDRNVDFLADRLLIRHPGYWSAAINMVLCTRGWQTRRSPVPAGILGGTVPLAASGSSRLLQFVQFPTFLRDWKRLWLGDDALRALERELITSPDKRPIIEQTGGLRKLRFTPPDAGRGKSGAYRVCYAYFPAFGTVALFVAFGKNEQSDLSSAEARATANALRTFEAELRRQFDHSTERTRNRT